MKLFATEVFTPNQFPEYTYIERPKEDLEGKLKRALGTPNVIVSLSGPSKSGKTVLAKKLVGEDNLIHVFGAEVRSGSELWERVLGWMDAPSSVTEQTADSRANKTGGEVAAKGSIIVAEASGKATFDTTGTRSQSTSTTRTDSSLSRVVRDLANSDYVVFLDDFHYIPGRSTAVEGGWRARDQNLHGYSPAPRGQRCAQQSRVKRPPCSGRYNILVPSRIDRNRKSRLCQTPSQIASSQDDGYRSRGVRVATAYAAHLSGCVF
jgi:hypothetical protein